MHAKNSKKVLVTTSENQSAVLETLLTQQKKETTLMHAKNSEEVPVTMSAEESAF